MSSTTQKDVVDFALTLPKNNGVLAKRLRLIKTAHGWMVSRVLVAGSDLEKNLLLSCNKSKPHRFASRKDLVQALNQKLIAHDLPLLTLDYQAQNIYESTNYPVGFFKTEKSNPRGWRVIYDAATSSIYGAPTWNRDTLILFGEAFGEQSFSSLTAAKQAASDFIKYYNLEYKP